MKIKTIAIALLLLSTAAFSAVAPSLGQTPNAPTSADTYKPGFWQPVARVKNVKTPIKVKFVNNTDYVLEYGLTDDRLLGGKLKPQGSTVMENVPIPSYFFTYSTNPERISSAGLRIKYQIMVTDNLVTVTVTTANDGAPSEATFNIDTTGAIYVS